MNSKGLLLTFSVLILALVVLQLSQIVKENVKQADAFKKDIIGIDNVSMKYENIEDNFQDILENVSALKINKTPTTIALTETLSKKKEDNKFTNLKIYLDNYNLFLEGYKDNLDVNLSYNLNDSLDLIVEPYDFNVSHPNVFTQGKRINNSIIYSPSRLDFNSYFLDLTLQNQSYESIQTNPASVPTCNNCLKALNIELIVRNSNKIPETNVSFTNIDASKKFTITINTSGESGNDIEIVFDNSKLTITNNNSVGVDLMSGIDFGDDANAAPHIRLPNTFIKVRDHELRTEKS